MDRLVIVKLGGSLITDKSKPYTLNRAALASAARLLAGFEGSLVVVHGGGSYGHAAAAMHGLSSGRASRSPRGASETRLAMHRLSLAVLEELFEAGLNPLLLPPPGFFFSGDPWRSMADAFRGVLRRGATPVTHGDVIPAGEGFRVLGGDEIAWGLAPLLKPERVVFLIDAPGVLRDPRDPESVVCCLSPSEASGRRLASRSLDVTGGLAAKLDFAARIARGGIDVYIVSGLSETDVLNALRGEKTRGTVVSLRYERDRV